MRTYFRGYRERVLDLVGSRGKMLEGAISGWSRRRVEQHLAKGEATKGLVPSANAEAAQVRGIFRTQFNQIWSDAGARSLSSVGASFAFNVNDPGVQAALGDRLDQFSRQISGTSFDAVDRILRAGFAEGEPLPVIADTLRKTFDSWDKYRAPLIARTEVVSAANEASVAAVRRADFRDDVKKVWLTAQDEAVRRTHAEAGAKYAKGIPVTQKFVVGGDPMDAPGGGKKASENVNCRCTVVFDRKARRQPRRPQAPSVPVAAPVPSAPVVAPSPDYVPLAGGDALWQKTHARWGGTIGERIDVDLVRGGGMSLAEIEAWAQERLSRIPALENIMVDFVDHALDPTVLARTVNGLLESMEYAPEAFMNLRYIGSLSSKAPGSGVVSNVDLNYFTSVYPDALAAANDRVIFLNPKFYQRDEAWWNMKMKQNAQKGWFPKDCGTIESIIQHETGHVIDHHFRMQSLESGAIKVSLDNLTTAERIDFRTRDRLVSQRLSKYRSKAEWDARKADNLQKHGFEKVSEYAGYTAGEEQAEEWARHLARTRKGLSAGGFDQFVIAVRESINMYRTGSWT